MTHTIQYAKNVQAYLENLVLPSSPDSPGWNRESIIYGKQPKWNYIDACMIRAMLMLDEVMDDERLYSYAERFTDHYITSDGSIPTMKIEDYNLDNINGGKNLLALYRKTGSAKYMNAIDKLMEQVTSQPRLECGNFWHKAVYPYQIWLDGIYMALPFIAEYAQMTDDLKLKDDVRFQLRNVHEIMYDTYSGLYYHGYDEKRDSTWADRVTGLSHEFWLRSIGWFCAALADMAEIVPDSSLISDMLGGLLEAVFRTADDSGMLYQLPLHREISGNYPETSGTLLAAYAAIKSYRLGITGNSLKEAGEKAFSAVTDDFITFESSRVPIMRNICLTAGLGGDRDGSVRYYLSEKMTYNDGKGIAPYLMTASELMKT